jgi:hypothetical protein
MGLKDIPGGTRHAKKGFGAEQMAEMLHHR